MRLLAPAGNVQSAINVLNAGADDIYLGALSPYLYNYSFNGRSTYNDHGNRIQADYNELKEIVNIAHSKGASVNFLANIPFINNCDSDTDNYEKSIIGMFEEYIESGLEAGIDTIVVGDLGALKILKRMQIKLPIVASSYFEAQNLYSVKFLEEMGVQRIILSYQVLLDEIINIINSTSLQIEVFGHGGCSFYVGSCNLFHDAGEGGKEGINVGYPCRGMYCVSIDGNMLERKRILDSFKICSFCQITRLIKAGVHMLKIVGRDLDLEFMTQVVQTYRRGIDLACNGEEPAAERSEILPVWWVKMWCDSGKRCRYQ